VVDALETRISKGGIFLFMEKENHMVKAIVAVVFFALSVLAEPVSLSGKVNKTGSTAGLSGVSVSLVKVKNLSTVSGADGSFTLSGSTAIGSPALESPVFRFTLKDNCLVFSSVPGKGSGHLELFSSDGRKLLSVDLDASAQGSRTIRLPQLRSGINVLRFIIGETTSAYSLLSLGNEQFLMNGSFGSKGVGSLSLTKRTAAAAVDTLVCAKTGFKTVKTPIAGYTSQNIAIQMDTLAETGGKCTREALQELANGYIAALEASDSTKMSLASNAKYIEQFKASSFGKWIWTTKIKANLHREFIDVDSCAMFVEILDNVSATPREIGARIKVSGGKIAEVSALVADKDDWNLSAADAFTFMYDKSKAESWTLIPADKQNDRKTIQAAGDMYLDMFSDQSVKMPWGNPCDRLEGKMYVACNTGVPSGSLKMTERQYVVDLEMGVVDVYSKFGGSSPDSHMLRMENGKIRYVHTITITGKN
jgi:hypothetical protein